MATVADLVSQVKAFAAGLGFDSAPDWADRPQPVTGTRALVRVVSTSEVAPGSNSTVRLVELELTGRIAASGHGLFQRLADPGFVFARAG
jgi:hypothetical protein